MGYLQVYRVNYYKVVFGVIIPYELLELQSGFYFALTVNTDFYQGWSVVIEK